MFGLLNDLAKSVVAAVSVPVALVVDSTEVVGLKHDSGVCHTQEALNAVVQNLETQRALGANPCK